MAGAASSQGLGWELLPGTHLGEWGSILIYSVRIKWKTRGFSPPSQTPSAGSHHPQVIPREMGWECSLSYKAPPVFASSRSRTATPWFMCLRLQYYTAERSSTAVTKRTALACSLGNTGANPVQPHCSTLLCKSPADWTSTCCSWHISIPLFGRLQIGRRSHLLRMHPTISTHHRDSCYCHNTPLLSGEAEEQGDTSCTQPATVNRIFPSQPWVTEIVI